MTEYILSMSLNEMGLIQNVAPTKVTYFGPWSSFTVVGIFSGSLYAGTSYGIVLLIGTI